MLRIANSLRRTHTLQSFYVASLHHSSAAYSDEKSADIPTHTGQVWDADDMRLARFEVAPKQVNSQWAINLIKEVPPKPIKGRIAVCEGWGR
ncbi:NADH dehydrogenase [ubiquinone] iron-sulfur protein 6, mitochondrial [Armadillidium nasatum]|uniref:NADH dehydrogenase [ubiquinone] iron-sulfur protein 6, mitochondrial n=1 Tax=Armadillidium nasatum TaxID=96803 RepID=A0A5N5THS2_9CRUS|nr:NADH dehydrogenase [ubiquinone] iron-sulfur protein 6, mitochondrial [Armadillidium nasatum]